MSDNLTTLGHQLMALPPRCRRCPFCLGELAYFWDFSRRKTPACTACQRHYYRQSCGDFRLVFEFQNGKIIGATSRHSIRLTTDGEIPLSKPVRYVTVTVQKRQKRRYHITLGQRTGIQEPQAVQVKKFASLKSVERLLRKWNGFLVPADNVAASLNKIIDPYRY